MLRKHEPYGSVFTALSRYFDYQNVNSLCSLMAMSILIVFLSICKSTGFIWPFVTRCVLSACKG